jgi:SAM-dependent methyltransferase
MTPSCPLCGSHATSLRPDTHSDNGTAYTLHACSTCGVQFWLPFQNPGSAWYEHDERYADRNQDPILTANKKQRDVLEYLGTSGGRLLDVGCGVGNFLAYARTRGWEGWGFDFDADAIATGTRTFGLDSIEVNDLAGFVAAHPELRFDLITFFDVFEHIDDHNEFLDLISSVLAPGGAIALSVPYRDGWRWLLPADLPPRHLTRWNESALENTLARHGLHTVSLWRLPASLYYLILKLRFRYGRWSSLNLVQKVRKAEAAPGALAGASSSRIEAVQLLAKIKDGVLFGSPALMLWLLLLPFPARYTDLYVVARRD